MRSPLGLLALSAPESRRPGAALAAGLVAGLTSGAVKMAWEAWFPPRTPDREVPPVTLLKQRGADPDAATYSYNGSDVPWGVLAVHFGFSVAVVTAYSVAAEYVPRTKMWGGLAYGIGAWFVAHEVILPRMGLTPKASELPLEEHLSEFFGHLAWLGEAELVRRSLRQVIAGVPDAETRTSAVAKLADTARAALRR